MFELCRLLLGTVLLRPYVFAFLTMYLVAAAAHLLAQDIAFPAGRVYHSLAFRILFHSLGFPYGAYFYIPTTVDRELWVFGVPFMDSLSYVFLSYCSYAMALFILSPLSCSRMRVVILETRRLRRSPQTLILGALLFVLLDVIIDPVAFQGHRWFLGQIYGYREPGLYFGIPMSNFGGWVLVGLAMMALLQLLDRLPVLDPGKASRLAGIPGVRLFGLVLYVSVLAFNLGVTFWIGETFMGIVGCLILFFPGLLVCFFTLYKQQHLTSAQLEEHAKTSRSHLTQYDMDFATVSNSSAGRRISPARTRPRLRAALRERFQDR